jgi:hypothetical protein
MIENERPMSPNIARIEVVCINCDPRCKGDSFRMFDYEGNEI